MFHSAFQAASLINFEIALAAAEKSLIDAETASANLRDGTHGSFDPDEIADKVFIVSDPLEDGLGYIQFDINSSTRTFKIISDGYESLVLRTSGLWPGASSGSNESVTLYLTRVGP